MESTLQVICLETEAFHQLIEDVVERLEVKADSASNIWIDDDEAMQLLRISSKTTLQKFRNEGRIRYSQPSKKVILYDRRSLLQFLEENAKDTF